ncbi:N-acetylmuramoyl-L-alanine amidase [Nocardioides panacis]|uniref:N-acetylmuramoyl-L-alanine amidase n=1 Tax=Nocardioides panacis TaxID=2849501 RepID=A0A975SUY4_9ACTN|nr:N-acetylmuramoyl-L-alanine amidase [Nocardioides panacis]QWZ06329.1 N-acetylmuramoyl-L-alanine amidase [Nocardioides panacis]
MHLTQDAAAAHARELAKAKGDGSPAALQTGTLTQAAKLVGVTRDRLRSDDVANVCGGAAVLASYQPRTTSDRPAAWSKAVGSYAGTATDQDRLDFARQVYSVIRSGESRTTNDGQRVTLAPTQGAAVDAAAVAATIPSGNEVVDCPAVLRCESRPAPYEQYGSTPDQYGNHDLADRPNDGLSIDYIVIHDTEASWQTSLDLVNDPTYLAWHYTIRSSDGQVAQHVNPKNVGFQAGNWYINMHSIGIEHEGFAATGASWYTESMYRSSATLVQYLSREYGVPLDRAHVIGHDQVPGTTKATIPGMHWDPGPFWDWEHYMALLGKPLDRGQHGKAVAARKGTGKGHGHGPKQHGGSDVVTIVPGFADNPQPVTNCDGAGSACTPQGTNFVYLRTAPSDTAPLVADPGLHQTGQASSTEVSDIGPRATAGQKFAVVARQDGWTAVWWLGELAWFKDANAAGDPVTVPSQGRLVRATGTTAVPVYGRGYPESAAYAGTPVPDQGVAPLGYTVKPGQSYVLADDTVKTDYYYAKTYDSSLPGGPHRGGGQGPLLPDLVRPPDRVRAGRGREDHPLAPRPVGPTLDRSSAPHVPARAPRAGTCASQEPAGADEGQEDAPSSLPST